jgi:hypothetical protein
MTQKMWENNIAVSIDAKMIAAPPAGAGGRALDQQIHRLEPAREMAREVTQGPPMQLQRHDSADAIVIGTSFVMR